MNLLFVSEELLLMNGQLFDWYFFGSASKVSCDKPVSLLFSILLFLLYQHALFYVCFSLVFSVVRLGPFLTNKAYHQLLLYGW